MYTQIKVQYDSLIVKYIYHRAPENIEQDFNPPSFFKNREGTLTTSGHVWGWGRIRPSVPRSLDLHIPNCDIESS